MVTGASNLIDLTVRHGEDVVETYTALREITIEKRKGINVSV